jgi:hypothetical protein
MGMNNTPPTHPFYFILQNLHVCLPSIDEVLKNNTHVIIIEYMIGTATSALCSKIVVRLDI